jgi:molybdenum cofactor biosynthesis protein B
MSQSYETFFPLNMAVLTVSDTRSRADDKSGDTLAALLTSAGHNVYERTLVKDDIYQIRAVASRWIADPDVQVVLVTGGTGFSGRDSTPEAVAPLLDKQIEGFGELFRHLSFADIGTSTIQSRALGGLANRTLVFCLPGSTNACNTAWQKILQPQLDSRTRPCNFAALVK